MCIKLFQLSCQDFNFSKKKTPSYGAHYAYAIVYHSNGILCENTSVDIDDEKKNNLRLKNIVIFFELLLAYNVI